MDNASRANKGIRRGCLRMLGRAGRAVTATELAEFMARQGAETEPAQIRHALSGLCRGPAPLVEITGTVTGRGRPANLYRPTVRGYAVLAEKPKVPAGRRVPVRRVASFDEANRRRQERAAAAASARVERALEILGPGVPGHLAEAGRLRLANPRASFTDLGRLADPPLTKDMVAGRLRALLALADQQDAAARASA
jgi:hypothetical protein